MTPRVKVSKMPQVESNYNGPEGEIKLAEILLINRYCMFPLYISENVFPKNKCF